MNVKDMFYICYSKINVMTDFFYWIGDFFYAFFSLFEKLGNLPNYFFIGLGFVLLAFWLRLQAKYNKKAAKDGSLK